jgi:hypothetical protein
MAYSRRPHGTPLASRVANRSGSCAICHQPLRLSQTFWRWSFGVPDRKGWYIICPNCGERNYLAFLVNVLTYTLSMCFGIGVCFWFDRDWFSDAPRTVVEIYIAQTKDKEPSWLIFVAAPFTIYAIRSALSYAWLQIGRARATPLNPSEEPNP